MTEEHARAFIEHQAFERGKEAARADLEAAFAAGVDLGHFERDGDGGFAYDWVFGADGQPISPPDFTEWLASRKLT